MEKDRRAILYARVSTDDQRGNYSVPTQISESIEYLESRGYALVGDLFIDPETGLDTSEGNGAIPAYVDDYTSRELSRPGLDKAFDFLESYGFDVVIVHSLDRLARDPYIRQTLENEFNELGASVEFATGNYDDTPEGEVRKDLDATFAKWENAKRLERVNRGKRGKAQKGLFVHGRAPYGYFHDKNEFGGLGVDEEQAEVVRYVFHQYVVENVSVRSLVKTLNNNPDFIPFMGENWATSSINRMLRNTAYIGHVYYNKHKRVGTKLIRRDRDEWMKILITPIVDDALFAEAQRKLEYNRKKKRKQPKRKYFLTGMIFCDECGKAYHSQTNNISKRRRTETPIYRHRKSAGHCLNRQISARMLDPLVWDKIKELLLDPENLREGYSEAVEKELAAQKRQQKYQEELISQIQKLEQRRRNLIIAYTDPDLGITKAEFLNQRTQLDDEIKKVRERIREIEARFANLPTAEEFETLERFAEEIRERLISDEWEPTLANKRRILQLLHVEVLVDIDRNIRLSGWFGKDHGLLSKTCS